MFTARFPIDFIVRGSYDAQGCFQVFTSETVLRFDRIPGQAIAVPDVEQNDFAGPWFIDEIPTPQGPRLFKLTLFGPAVMDMLACEPMHPLIVALLDQTTIKLSLNTGPIPPDDIGPDVPKDFVATLFLKLTLHIS